MTRIPIVNEQDEIIAYKERKETTRDDIRRIIGLDVFNEKGEVLIAKRHVNKEIDPDLWGPSVAGTVDEGFDYDGTVLKEAEEEIGLVDITPVFSSKYFYETPYSRRWCTRYYVLINSRESYISKMRKFRNYNGSVLEILKTGSKKSHMNLCLLSDARFNL